jgi:hypothetical protein
MIWELKHVCRYTNVLHDVEDQINFARTCCPCFGQLNCKPRTTFVFNLSQSLLWAVIYVLTVCVRRYVDNPTNYSAHLRFAHARACKRKIVQNNRTNCFCPLLSYINLNTASVGFPHSHSQERNLHLKHLQDNGGILPGRTDAKEQATITFYSIWIRMSTVPTSSI